MCVWWIRTTMTKSNKKLNKNRKLWIQKSNPPKNKKVKDIYYQERIKEIFSSYQHLSYFK